MQTVLRLLQKYKAGIIEMRILVKFCV